MRRVDKRRLGAVGVRARLASDTGQVGEDNPAPSFSPPPLPPFSLYRSLCRSRTCFGL